MNLGRRNRVKAEGGMSSMTDLVFLMLIFFIIMSTMTEPGVEVNLPSPKQSITPPPTTNVINVGVTPENMYLFAGEPDALYTYEEIEPMIMTKMSDNLDNNKIKISGDKNADYEFVFRLISLAAANQWKPILVFE